MSALPRVVYLDSTEVEVEKAELNGLAQVSCYSAKTVADIPDDVAEAAVVGVWHTIWLDAALLSRLKSAKCIVRMGVGYDNVDVKTAGELGIPVCNIPDYGTEEVADSAMSHILNMYRGTYRLAHEVALGARIQGPDGIATAGGKSITRVRGSKLGIVGLGRIGAATAIRAKAFGFEVLFYDPFVVDGTDKIYGIRRLDTLEQLLRESQTVSLHCNATKANEKMMNADAFGIMQRGSFLVNTARGELVDEEALAAALTSGQVGYAALDVHWGEPYVRGHGPLGDAPNLVCTPHSAWFSNESRLEMRCKGAETARRALSGEPLRNVVNQQQLRA